MFHCFYHERFMPAEAQRGDLQSAQNGAKIQDSLLFTQITPSLIPQWMASLTPSTARPVGHMTVLTPPPRCGRKKASGCINKGAKWEGGPEAEQTRWRWSSLGFTLCLQLQGFFCGPVVGLLHPWSATSTPEVRPQALKCYLDFYILKNMLFFFIAICCSSTVCVWGEALLTGWNLDGRLYAVHLSAPRRRRLLRDVSTQTTWCPDALNNVVNPCLQFRFFTWVNMSLLEKKQHF